MCQNNNNNNNINNFNNINIKNINKNNNNKNIGSNNKINAYNVNVTKGLLATSSSANGVKAGSSSCPWRLHYKLGQQVKIQVSVYGSSLKDQLKKGMCVLLCVRI